MIIYFIPTSYPDKEHPTKDIFIYEQAKALAAEGNKIIILHVVKHPTSELFNRINKNIKVVDDGFATRYVINCHTFREEKYSMLNGKHFSKKMLTLFEYAMSKEGMPDVLYAHFSLHAGYAAVKIKEKYGIPVMALEHYSGFMVSKISSYKRKTLAMVLENADVFAAVSEGLRRNIIELLKADGLSKLLDEKSIEVIYNMVDPAFQYTPPPHNEEFTFFSLGRLAPPKRFDLLINAFCCAFNESDAVKLKIAGIGEYQKELEKLINGNKRHHQIQLLGNLDRKDIVKEFQNCDCFALVSSWETFGLVWREAMAVGRPIITNDHGGFLNWNDGWGKKVLLDDAKELSDVLRYMKNHCYDYDAKEISKACLSRCSSKVIASQILTYLESITEKGKVEKR